jgi:hypothetical protein
MLPQQISDDGIVDTESPRIILKIAQLPNYLITQLPNERHMKPGGDPAHLWYNAPL